MYDLAPASTAHTPIPNTEQNRCRTPRRARGSPNDANAANRSAGTTSGSVARSGNWSIVAAISEDTDTDTAPASVDCEGVDNRHDHQRGRVRAASTPSPACGRTTRPTTRLCRGRATGAPAAPAAQAPDRTVKPQLPRTCAPSARRLSDCAAATSRCAGASPKRLFPQGLRCFYFCRTIEVISLRGGGPTLESTMRHASGSSRCWCVSLPLPTERGGARQLSLRRQREAGRSTHP